MKPKKEPRGAKIILAVTGGIAAYKACELLRLFIKDGHSVKVVMTKNAAEFITPLTMETLSSGRVYTDLFAKGSFSTEHISLAKWGDILLVAPATANAIGKFASGIADDLLSTLYLSFKKTVVIAPAMHTEMYNHPAVRANIEALKSLGVRFVEPDSGELASGDWGEGRLPEPFDIKRQVLSLLNIKLDLKGKRILVTAGPTRENIDPARHISSPSSGKMGVAIAQEAADRGARVTLVHGPIWAEPVFPGKKIKVSSSKEMLKAVMDNRDCDIFISAAAVCDFVPANPRKDKIKKTGANINIELSPNIDILGSFSKKYSRKKIIVGFAAETNDIEKNARAKLVKKNLDMIVANDVSQKHLGFESDFNAASIIYRNGRTEKLAAMPKRELARAIVDNILKVKK